MSEKKYTKYSWEKVIENETHKLEKYVEKYYEKPAEVKRKIDQWIKEEGDARTLHHNLQFDPESIGTLKKDGLTPQKERQNYDDVRTLTSEAAGKLLEAQTNLEKQREEAEKNYIEELKQKRDAKDKERTR